jgi:hypothetical protein
MTCGSNDEKDANELETMGIIKSHSYSLMAAREIDFEGAKTKIVVLRNPWGVSEWKGKFGNNDENYKKLTPMHFE